MWPKLNSLLGRNKQEIISRSKPSAAQLIKKLFDYYSSFQQKLDLFKELKNSVIEIKSEIYDAQLKEYKKTSQKETEELQKTVNCSLIRLVNELNKVNTLIQSELKIEKESTEYSSELISFIDNEFKKEDDYKTKTAWPKYKQLLQDLKNFLLNSENSSYGIFHILSSQLDLLKDIEIARKEIESGVKQFEIKNRDFERLKATLRILEIEIMRFGKYCEQEAKIIGFETKKFEQELSALRELGLVYSEKTVTPYNIGLIAGNLRKQVYGFKGIGIIKEDVVELRFVKGVKERHAEIVQMLFEGMPGMKLSSDQAVMAYLHSLPAEKIVKIAGYEAQLKYDEKGELKIVNIDYSSTILQVQIERKTIQGEFAAMSKKDFQRLNYALLMSIDKRVLDEERFESNIEKHGSKITVSAKAENIIF